MNNGACLLFEIDNDLMSSSDALVLKVRMQYNTIFLVDKVVQSRCSSLYRMSLLIENFILFYALCYFNLVTSCHFYCILFWYDEVKCDTSFHISWNLNFTLIGNWFMIYHLWLVTIWTFSIPAHSLFFDGLTPTKIWKSSFLFDLILLRTYLIFLYNLSSMFSIPLFSCLFDSLVSIFFFCFLFIISHFLPYFSVFCRRPQMVCQ